MVPMDDKRPTLNYEPPQDNQWPIGLWIFFGVLAALICAIVVWGLFFGLMHH